jgi:hypothetical protein
VRPYEPFYRDYANPFLRDRGFVRKGRTYRRYADNGDCAVVHFQASEASYAGHHAFFINVAVVPRPWHEYGPVHYAFHHPQSPPAAEKEPDAATGGMYWRRVDPPPGCYSWSVTDAENFALEWRQLEGPLSAEVGQLVALLDRDTFVSYCLNGGGYIFPYREVVLAVLLSDSADASKLEELLLAIDAKGSDWPFTTSHGTRAAPRRNHRQRPRSRLPHGQRRCPRR